MKPRMRRFKDENDYWAIREFLRRVYLRNGRRELSWQTSRMDWWRWHGIMNLGDGSLEADVFIWEEADGQIAAVLNREAAGQVFLQVHPDMKTPELEAEMIAVAQEHLMIRSKRDGKLAVWIWAAQDDAMRAELLAARGFTRRPPENHSYHHRLDLTGELPTAALPQGFVVRALAGDEELPARSWLSWKGFHYGEPDEEYDGWEWYLNVLRIPLYRRDLDLVAVAPSGELASCCTIWFDDSTRTGAFEPVATHGAYRRMGLGTAVLHEGLRRLKRLGATLATVGAEEAATHKFYLAVGFNEWDVSVAWEKRI